MYFDKIYIINIIVFIINTVSMSIFLDLCHETDEVVQKAGILNAVSFDAREKVANILSDTSTTSDIVRNPA